MSQHPAPNTPITAPEIRATDPAPGPDLAALRAAIEAAGWDERDRLAIQERAIWLECTCGCSNANGVTRPVAIWADDIANLIVQATNALPALLARIAELERAVEDQVSEIADKGAAITTLRERVRDKQDRIAELESAQANPDAYIAVKRNDAACAEGPEWLHDAAVIPVGDPHGYRPAFEWSGYEFLPIVGTETGTRFAAPQPDPAGYVVATRNPEGGLHRAAQIWESLEQANTAEGIASGYADGTGCTVGVYELHEVAER